MGSGNLGLVYLMEEQRRLTLEEIDERHPRLLPALREHPHVGWLLVRSAEHGAGRPRRQGHALPVGRPGRGRGSARAVLADRAPASPSHGRVRARRRHHGRELLRPRARRRLRVRGADLLPRRARRAPDPSVHPLPRRPTGARRADRRRRSRPQAAQGLAACPKAITERSPAERSGAPSPSRSSRRRRSRSSGYDAGRSGGRSSDRRPPTPPSAISEGVTVSDDIARTQLPIPDRPYEGELPLVRRGSRDVVPADRAAAAAGGRAERADRADRRRRLRRLERLRRAVLDADRRAARRERPQVQPLPHDRALLADAPGAAHRAATTTRSGWAAITEIATSAPGYNSIRPNTCAPLAETLKLNGYATAQFGKCHEVPVWETSPMGPFDAWPTGSGFEHFYGFIGGETNQYAPAIYRDTVPIERRRPPRRATTSPRT